jgi:MoaA/NifB/PqqE/SkfB family radical SAM enzyme
MYSSLYKSRIAEKRIPRLMPFEIIEKVISETASNGLKEIIPSTMGEPLLYKDFDKIIDICSAYKIKMNLTTNGTFPGKGVIEWAKRIVPITSDIKFSWNGATKKTYETIMAGCNWEKALENVKSFIAIRDSHFQKSGYYCRVTFQLTFMEFNIDELVEIVRLALHLGVDRIKGHHLWVHFEEIKNLSMRRSPDAIRRWNVAVEKVQQIADETLLNNGKKILLENIFTLNQNTPQNISSGGVCPFLGKEAWISALGRFDPCCAPDAQRRALGEFGNLHTDSFLDIWNGDSYLNLVKSYADHPLCLSCNMRKPAGEL